MPIMNFMTRYYHSFSFKFRVDPTSRNFFGFFHSGLFILALFSVMACEEGPTKLGSELLPGSDFITINSTDTLSAWSYTTNEVSTPTNSPGVAFIGDTYDPYFGTTTAGFVSQVRLGSKWSYGPVTIDSMKLNLKLSIKGGSADVPHTMRISEISDMLSLDSTYYNNTPANLTGFEVTAQLPKLKPDTINTVSFAVPVSFGEYLIRDTTKIFYSTSKPDFRNYFKGVYLRLDKTTDPLMVTFNITSTAALGTGYNNFFVLYMHDTTFTSISYYFILDPVHANACYNKFERDYSAAEPGKRITHLNDYTYRDTLSYIQSLDGLYTKIIFPGLDSLKKKLGAGKVSVNKARLAVPVYYDGNEYTIETVPASLRMRFTNNSGLKQDVPDYLLDSNHQFYDGTLHKTDSTYYFNIASYIQLFFDDKVNAYKPEVELYQGTTVLSSAILRTSKNRLPVKFQLTYTKL